MLFIFEKFLDEYNTIFIKLY